MRACKATGGNCAAVIAKYQKISDERSAELDSKCKDDPVMCQGWDKELAHGGISPIFDKEKEQKRLQEVQLIGQIGNQAADIARTQGEINGLNAGKKALAKEGIPEPDVNASDEEKARYQTQLRNSAAYKTEQAKYGTGSDIQRGIQAAVGALQGLAGGDIGAALAGASAPELANIIGHKAGLNEDDIAAKAIAHAILGGAAAAMQGNNAAAGAAGAVAGELAANAILKTMYPGKHVSELDESDRQLVSNLATIASGLAGNLAGGDSKSTTTGAQSGKNAVENNFLSQGSPQKYTDKYKECNGNAGCEQGIRKDMAQESAENIQKLKSCWDAGDAACVAETRSKIELDEKAYTELRQQDNMAGRAYEDSAKWYADIIDQCAGKCDWLEASLLKTGADGLGNLVYGALGVGSVAGGKPSSATTVENSGAKGVIPNTNSALKLGERAIINEVNVTRVGRWMSPDELAQMQNGGKVVQGGGGQTFISTNGVSDFKATAPAGSVYVEFDVPTNSLLQGGKDGWFKLIGPDASKSQQFMLNKQGGSQLPEVKNITVVDKK